MWQRATLCGDVRAREIPLAIAGAAATRIGQPAVFGELLVGLLLGPTVLNVLSWPMFFGAVTETPGATPVPAIAFREGSVAAKANPAPDTSKERLQTFTASGLLQSYLLMGWLAPQRASDVLHE